MKYKRSFFIKPFQERVRVWEKASELSECVWWRVSEFVFVREREVWGREKTGSRRILEIYNQFEYLQNQSPSFCFNFKGKIIVQEWTDNHP